MMIPARRSLGFLLFVALVLSACTPGLPSPTATRVTPTLKGTPTPIPTLTTTPLPSIGVDPAALRGIDIQVWDAFAGGASSVFDEQVARFNSVNEWGIVVTRTASSDYPALFDAVSTSIDSGSATPDLVATLPEETLAWNASGAVVDLSPYLNDPVFGLGGDGQAAFPPAFLAQDAVDGKQLGVPAQRSARFLFYNQTWAHELGFDNPPATADEFRRQACAANASFRTDTNLQNDGYGGWFVDTDWQTTYSWLLAFGGGVVNGNTYGFSTARNLTALQFLKGLFDDHCAWIPDATVPVPLTPPDAFARRLSLFISGDLAEVPLVTESMSRLKSGDEWTLIPFPGTTGKVLVTYGPSYSVLRSTPEKQLAAWLFARWLLSPENQTQWVDATGLLPLLNSVRGTTEPIQWAVAVSDLSLAQGVPQLASWRTVRYVLEDGTNIIFQTNVAVDQISSVLAEMDSTAEEISNK